MTTARYPVTKTNAVFVITTACADTYGVGTSAFGHTVQAIATVQTQAVSVFIKATAVFKTYGIGTATFKDTARTIARGGTNLDFFAVDSLVATTVEQAILIGTSARKSALFFGTEHTEKLADINGELDVVYVDHR